MQTEVNDITFLLDAFGPAAEVGIGLENGHGDTLPRKQSTR
jgi:hypothetical protein